MSSGGGTLDGLRRITRPNIRDQRHFNLQNTERCRVMDTEGKDGVIKELEAEEKDVCWNLI